jgi:hypothetical protein
MLNYFETIPSLERLKRKLRKAFRKHDYDDTIALQDGYVDALDHVAEFFDRAGIDEGIAGKFAELAHAIWGLRYGTVAKSVRPAKVGGQGPDGVTVWCLRADVVIGLECILKSQKKKKRDAAEYIAKKYPIFDRLKRKPGASLTTSILSWRDRINAGKAPESVALPDQHSFFQQHCSDDLSPTEMFALGEDVLREAAKNTTKAAF